MNVLVDIGNSRFKWLIEQAGQMQPVVSLDFRPADFLSQLRLDWKALPIPEKFALASVSDQSLTRAVLSLAIELWPDTQLLLPFSTASAFGVRNAYEKPHKLGIDRWLSLWAVHTHFPGQNCIIDCGTAITVDVLDAEGRHQGGLINPGLRLMRHSLAAETSQLGLSKVAARLDFASATEHAIAAGSLYAAVGMIEAVMRRLPSTYRLILCGGDAASIAEHLSIAYRIEPLLVFQGLSLFCRDEPPT